MFQFNKANGGEWPEEWTKEWKALEGKKKK